jgi:hypothetical protein
MKMMKGITKRGKSYQAKYRRTGQLTRTATFPTYEWAVAFMVRCEADGLRPNETPTTVTVVDGPTQMTIQQLYERVDRQRWNGNPDCKAPKNGSPGNARRFIAWVGKDT